MKREKTNKKESIQIRKFWYSRVFQSHLQFNRSLNLSIFFILRYESSKYNGKRDTNISIAAKEKSKYHFFWLKILFFRLLEAFPDINDNVHVWTLAVFTDTLTLDEHCWLDWSTVHYHQERGNLVPSSLSSYISLIEFILWSGHQHLSSSLSSSCSGNHCSLIPFTQWVAWFWP